MILNKFEQVNLNNVYTEKNHLSSICINQIQGKFKNVVNLAYPV